MDGERDHLLDMIEALHDELEAEHKALPGDWLGRPRKRHHEIMGASRALKLLHRRILFATRPGERNG